MVRHRLYDSYDTISRSWNTPISARLHSKDVYHRREALAYVCLGREHPCVTDVPMVSAASPWALRASEIALESEAVALTSYRSCISSS